MSEWGKLTLTAGFRSYVLVEARIFLRHGFIPDNVTGREAHDDINVRAASGELIHIMTKCVGLCEQDFCEILCLFTRQDGAPEGHDPCLPTLVSDERSSHWRALLMFAKARIPSGSCSANLFCSAS